jgi:hypothetical protein
MKRAVSVFLFSASLVYLGTYVANAAGSLSSELPKLVTDAPVADPNGPVPLGFSMVMVDVPCKDIINSIPLRLEMLGFMFEWTDREAGMVTVGPITQELETASVYSTVRETYFLKTVCHNELSTNISGEILLEGLQSDGQWIGITDSETIEQHSLEFFHKLHL